MKLEGHQNTTGRERDYASVSFGRTIRFMWSFFSRFPFLVGFVYLMMTINVGFELLFPLATGWLADAITIPAAPNEEQFSHAFFLVLVLIGQSVGYHLSVRAAHFTNCVLDSRVERLVAFESFRSVQHLSTDWHTNSFAGSTVTKIKRAMRAMHAFYDIVCYDMYPTLAITVGLIVLIIQRQVMLGIIFGIFAILYSLLSIVLNIYYVAPANRKANREDNHIGASLADALSCNPTVKSFASELHEEKLFHDISTKWMLTARWAWIRGNIVSLIQSIILNILKFMILGGAVWFWYIEIFTSGDVFFVHASYFMVIAYLRTIGDRIKDLQQARNDMEDAIQFADMQPSILDDEHASALQIQKGQCTFSKVCFSYQEDMQNILDNFSLDIMPGEKVALVGHSGGGKTTVVKLLFRFYNIQSGEILIDGQNIAHVTQESLRSSIGLVPQDPLLFHRSIAENIAYGKPDASFEEIQDAAKKAHADEFVQTLPHGYDTFVGERGIKLSGGERQRIAIARIILANLPVLILDEATSSLDSQSEKYIQDALHTLMEGRTTIVIAHRLSTIKLMDRIIVIENGQIIEEGNHDTLLKKEDGTYRQLYELQAGGFLGE